MKIKRLSILGFKSFMERLEIAFPMGISGVVGPNGCGKSNIVDAIRWCLGEQSPKQLRGRRMEDIIFNGAGDQRPMGMAEVSIVFENGDNSFPPPFTQDPELSVTRRLYRSGESEYLINNVPCRLKDIQEIFMDTGLSNNAYSVIGQGQIGTILEQKPEETRVMLEEAAGITKYRKKVAASQRKIEQTEANLQRVEDILAEVQRQMRSLKRQAGKARRYKAVSEEIRNLELVLYANTYEQLQVELGSKKQSTDSLAEREVERSARYAQLQAKIEGMNLEMEEKESLLSTCRADYLRLQERVHKKEAGLESLTGEMKMQEEMGVRLKGEKEQITTRLSSLKDERTRLNKDLDTLKKNSRDLEAEISLEENRLKSRRESLNSVREEYEKVRGELSDGANKEAGLNHGSDYLNRMLHQITDRRSRLESELNEVQAKIEKLMKAAEGKTQAREASMHRMEEIDGAINAQDMNCQQLAETKDQTEAELKAAETELHSSESRLGSLRALTENFEGYKVGVRTIMKAKGFEPREKGRIMGLVADVIQVAPQYEQAVEAVLADKLQYVIVESQEDGKEAVEYLKQRARGRSSFFPLKDIAGGSPNERTGSVASILKDRVTVPDS
jgi:chromosome segregation protein